MGPSQIGFRRPNSKRVWSLQLRLQGRLQERDQWGWAADKLKWAFIVLTGAPSQFNLYLQTWTETVGLKRKVVFPPLPLLPSPYPQRGWKRIKAEVKWRRQWKRRDSLSKIWVTDSEWQLYGQFSWFFFFFFYTFLQKSQERDLVILVPTFPSQLNGKLDSKRVPTPEGARPNQISSQRDCTSRDISYFRQVIQTYFPNALLNLVITAAK